MIPFLLSTRPSSDVNQSFVAIIIEEAMQKEEKRDHEVRVHFIKEDGTDCFISIVGSQDIEVRILRIAIA